MPFLKTVKEKIKNTFTKVKSIDIKSWRKWPKKRVTILLIIVLAIAGFYYYSATKSSSTQTRTITGTITKGNIEKTVSVSGNIDANIKQTASFVLSDDAKITDVYVKVGDTVKKGQQLAKIDSDDLENKLAQSQSQLTISRNNLNNTYKKDEPTQYDLSDLNEKVKLAEADLDQAKKDLANKVSTLDSSNKYDLYSLELKVEEAESQLEQAENNLDDAESKGLTSSEIDNYEEKVDLAESALDLANYNLQKAKDDQSQNTNYEIDAMKKKVASAESALTQAKNNLAKTTEEKSYTVYDIANLNENIRNSQLSYNIAKNNLDDTVLKSDIDGIVASNDMAVGDSTADKSIIIANPNSFYLDVSLTEYNATQLKQGTSAVITFEALEDKEYLATISEISLSPEISSNVVSYKAKIAITANDGQLRLGLTGKAKIVLQSKQDVLLANTSALISSNGKTYLKVIENGKTIQKEVTTGLVGDTQTEILSGVNEGDTIVVSVVQTSTTTTTSSNSLFGGGNRSSSSSSSKSSGSTSSGGQSGPPPM